MGIQIQLRRGTALEWSNINPVLAEGEQGLETDTNKIKVGNGIDLWNDLPYLIQDTTDIESIVTTKGDILVRNSTSLQRLGVGTNGYVLMADSSTDPGIKWGEIEVPTPQAIPSGSLMPYAGPGPSAPSGWMLCDGAAISRTTYSDLFSVIGTNYGIGDGSTTFNIPNLQNRIPIGSGVNFALASTGGQQTITQVPQHSHGIGTIAGSSGTDSGHSHTVAIDHSHSVDIQHNHTVDTAHSHTTNISHSHTGSISGGDHSHGGIVNSSTLVNANESTQRGSGVNRVNGNRASNTSTNSASHTHTVTIASGGSTAAASSSAGASAQTTSNLPSGTNTKTVTLSQNSTSQTGGSHSHTITMSGNTSNSGTASVNVMNPYIAVNYIIKL